MDILKQLESKLRTLVEQRNQLKDELEGLQRSQEAGSQELVALRQKLDDLQAERDTLLAERDGTRKDVEKILKLLEGAG